MTGTTRRIESATSAARVTQSGLTSVDPCHGDELEVLYVFKQVAALICIDDVERRLVLLVCHCSPNSFGLLFRRR